MQPHLNVSLEEAVIRINIPCVLGGSALIYVTLERLLPYDCLFWRIILAYILFAGTYQKNLTNPLCNVIVVQHNGWATLKLC